MLYKTDYLKTCSLEMFQIACHLQSGTVDIGLDNLDALYRDLRSQVFQFHLLDQSGQTNIFHAYLSSVRS